MRKVILTTILAAGFVAANAQSTPVFKRFKFDISAGCAVPTTSANNDNAGFLISFEPKYAINDQIILGLKAETAIAIIGDEDVKGTGSYLATGDYYFSNNLVRPFAGAGIGIYTHASANVNTSDDIVGTTRFGGAPRIGVEIAHFRAAIEYNFAGKVDNISKNYIGFKMGVLIGGGRIQY